MTGPGQNRLRVLTQAVFHALAGHTPWPELARFGAVGLLNTAFGYGAFLLLLETGMPAFPALMLSTVAGIAFNFQTSRTLVFRTRRSGLLPRFALIYGALFEINWAALTLAKHWGLADWAAQGLLVLPLALLSYLAQRIIVFGRDRGRLL